MYTKLLLFMLLLLIPFTINDENEDEFGKLYMEFLQEQYLEAIRNPIKYEPLSDEQVAQWLNEYDAWKNRQLLSQSEPTINITLILNNNGDTHDIELPSDSTFNDLQTTARQLFPDLKPFKFVFNGKEIKPNTDTVTLSDLKISTGSVINVQISKKLEEVSPSVMEFEIDVSKVYELLQELSDQSSKDFVNAEYELLYRIDISQDSTISAFSGKDILCFTPKKHRWIHGNFYNKFEIDTSGNIMYASNWELMLGNSYVKVNPGKPKDINLDDPYGDNSDHNIKDSIHYDLGQQFEIIQVRF